uniref:Transcription factor domain-containing protein n=2 Tax=Bionectria ochroleuca TaxID=29856 RepID=A0A8H7MYH6_BIOOC
MGYTIRIVHILSQIISWNGRGGRHVDTSFPWLTGTAFYRLDEDLNRWRSVIPVFLQYSPQNASAIIALGKGKPWSMMWMVYFQARAYLHREYLPFTPQEEYDPLKGPSDGPALTAAAPKDFWYSSAAAMIESANSISNLYQIMKKRDLSASAYPIPGLGLLTAASVHVVYSIFSWDSMSNILSPEESRSYLKQDMDAFNDIGQRWCLAIHWMRQISLFYKLNLLTKQSWANNNGNDISSMNVKEIKDGIMNFVRQISLKDRQTRDVNLKPTFDFDGWVSAMQSSVNQEQGMELEGELEIVESDSLSTVYVEDLQVGLLNNVSGMFYLDGLAEMGLSGDVDSLVEEWGQSGLE